MPRVIRNTPSYHDIPTYKTTSNVYVKNTKLWSGQTLNEKQLSKETTIWPWGQRWNVKVTNIGTGLIIISFTYIPNHKNLTRNWFYKTIIFLWDHLSRSDVTNFGDIIVIWYYIFIQNIKSMCPKTKKLWPEQKSFYKN